MDKAKDIKNVITRLSQWDQKLDFHKPVEKTSDIKAYLDYYSINHENVDLHFGYMEVDKTKVMAQIFKPKQSIGTVFLLHGYLNHVGHLRHLIHFLNKHHYSVISYDLQGHGLSEGATATVTHFSDYLLTMEKLVKKARDEMLTPFYVIGHSTGGAIIMNYLLKNRGHHYDKVILIAPLIRSSHWHLTKLGYYLTKPFPFIDDIKRKFRENSSNQSYAKFTKQDPLQPSAIPLEWLEALIKWNEKMETFPPTNTETCVIQGTKDQTVDWRYNLRFIKEKFNHLQVVQIENGRHALLNEAPHLREKVFTSIHQFLSDSTI